MRKWMGVFAVLTLSALMLTACGKKDTDIKETTQTEATEAQTEMETAQTDGLVEYPDDAYVSGIKVADYVTLGNYKGLEVSVEKAAVTDEYLNSYIDYVLQSNLIKTDVTDRAVEEGDYVNIDFEGKLNGETFEGGSSQGYELEIGSDSFIDGFEDGLIGAGIGEKRDIDLTFPENYGNEELSGKAVVFTVTVNSIFVETAPELNDEFVKGLNVDCNTVDEYRKYAFDMLMEEAQNEHDSNAQVQILDLIVGAAQLQTPPESMVTRYYDRITANLTSYASAYGMDLASYLAATGATEDQIRQSAADASNEILIMQAIADQEKLNVSDEEAEEALKENAAEYGYEDIEEYKNAIDYKAFTEYLMTNNVFEFLIENSVITDVEAPVEETAAQTETAGEDVSATEAGDGKNETSESEPQTVSETQSKTTK